MKWTSERPNQAGWFWWKRSASHVHFEPVQVSRHEQGVWYQRWPTIIDIDDSLKTNRPGGLWAGPIPVPEE